MRKLAGSAALMAAAAIALVTPSYADEVTVEMNLVSAEGVGASIGTVTMSDAAEGMSIKLDLSGDLQPGEHGFHVHENPSCTPAEKDGETVAAQSAGGHLDPESTGVHAGPEGEGHLGDLPAIQVGEGGTADATLTAPRLEVADVRGRALMIHEGGDNYSDQPEPLGGGGARVACGVVPAQ